MDERVIAGKYAIQGEIARGGMGVVYKALHTTLNREVAIKVLHPQYSGDPSFLKRFQREARAMARLSHANIIGVFDVTEDHGAHSIVMEFFDGKDLKRLIIERGRFSAVDTVSVAAQVTDGLAYAHAQGIVHRDIKPGNIMMDDRRRVKIADFGIAAATDEISVTTTGQIIGTPEYMSPEQARGEQLDGRSDLYSLGMVLYEMLTGQTPFEGISRMAIVGKLIYEKDELALQFPPDVPAELQDLIRTLLKKQPDHRLPDALALLAQLGALTEDLGVAPAVARGPSRSTHTGPTPRNTALVRQKDEEGPTVMLHDTPTETRTGVRIGSEVVAERTPPPIEPPRATPRSSTPPRSASQPKSVLPPPPPAPKPVRSGGPGWVAPFAVGVAAIVLGLGGVVYYLSGTTEQPVAPISAEPPADVAPASLTELRDLQSSLRTAQDQVAQSRREADTAQAATQVPDAYGQAADIEAEASRLLQDGSGLITQRRYVDAKTALQESLARFGRAQDEFGRARQAALAKVEEDERLRAVRERQQRARAVAAPKPPPAPAPKKVEPKVASTPPPAPPAAPPRPDIEVVGGVLSQLKMAYEKRDLRTLQRISDLSEGRVRFLQQIFQEYPTIAVSISGFSVSTDSASAVISITKLVNRNGETVKPGDDWKHAKVVLRKRDGGWGKAVW